ncbi:MAG: histidinol dehydrogenase [Peptostreptococcaceae bacterium]|nr:histidinol dehydrogenase [Peptostreptococcaceae bacterium]
MKIIKVSKDFAQDKVSGLLKRGADDFKEIDEKVREIISEVREKGDSALYSYTEIFDRVILSSIRVGKEEIEEAAKKVDPEFLEVLKEAAENIRVYHEKQKEETWMFENEDKTVLGQIIRPLSRVGIYIPGGKAAYPSTVLMNAIPAKVAGVEQIAMVTPPDLSGGVNLSILAAAYVAGVHEIYKVGGAQAIAALAYGTETITPVDKITGPGNIYVARAKQAVFGTVAIDMMAGPSEIFIIADEKQNPECIAADLLSQAEHDELAGVILATTSQRLAEEVAEAVGRQAALLERKEIAEASVRNNGFIFVTENLEQAFEIANVVAPEHLELLLENPDDYLESVRNAGAIFLGPYSPEPVGDYFAGPNHTLPTSGTARFSSALGVYDFIKRTSYIKYSKQALEKNRDKIIKFARKEGLTAHANSIKVRFDNND